MVRPEGIEPPAYRFEACRSIHLSYGRIEIQLQIQPSTLVKRLALGKRAGAQAARSSAVGASRTLSWPACSAPNANS
jgi:hypothetical protein